MRTASRPWKADERACVRVRSGGHSTVLELLDSGAHVIAGDDLYGGTVRLFERVRRRSAGLEFTFVDLSDPRLALESAIRPEDPA